MGLMSLLFFNRNADFHLKYFRRNSSSGFFSFLFQIFSKIRGPNCMFISVQIKVSHNGRSVCSSSVTDLFYRRQRTLTTECVYCAAKTLSKISQITLFTLLRANYKFNLIYSEIPVTGRILTRKTCPNCQKKKQNHHSRLDGSRLSRDFFFLQFPYY